MLITQFIEKEILQKIDTTVKLKNSLQSLTYYHFNLCGENWLPLTMKIEIDGVIYEVENSDDQKFQYMINHVFLTPPQIFKLLNFHFFTGSPIDVTKQFSSQSNIVSEKTPFVWLPLTSAPRLKVDGDRTISYPNRYSNLRIFFLGSTFYDRWNDKQRMEGVIIYLAYFCKKFVDEITLNRLSNGDISYDLLPLVKFANTDKNGHTSNILDETQLSGIELNLTFNIEEQCEKCNHETNN